MRQLDHLNLNAPETEDEVTYSQRDLSRFVRFIYQRLTDISRWATIVVVLLTLAILLFTGVTSWMVLRANKRDCHNLNERRNEVIKAFEGLDDKFIEATNGSQDAIDFKESHMSALRKGLPLRDC